MAGPLSTVLPSLQTVDIDGVDFLWPGTWNGDPYTDADLDTMVEETNHLIRSGTYNPFIKIGHADEQSLLAADELPAGGYVKRLYRRGEKTYADLTKVPAKLAQLVKAGAYNQRSAEVWYDGISFEGTRYRKPLKAISFLGATVPAVSSLDDIAARYAHGHTYTDAAGNAVHVVTLAGAAPVDVAADGSHDAMTGTHSHHHPAFGASGGDAQHQHEHDHDGDASHRHSHAAEMRDFDKNVGGGTDRDKMDAADFAGPNRTYPIKTPGDVSDAASLIGKAANPDAVKRRIISIAKRKGASFVAELPKSWAADDARKNALRTLAGKPSQNDICYAVQDALQDRYPYVYTPDGSAPSGVMADGPSQDIEDLYDDSVVVWDQDHDELWQLPWTMDDTGCVTLGAPQKVRTSYEPLADGDAMSNSYAESANRRASPLPHDPDPQGNRDLVTVRTSDQARQQQSATPTTPDDDADDDGAAAMEKMLADMRSQLDGLKGKRGIGTARQLHTLLAKHMAAMKGQWPDIDTAGNTDGSEGPDGEDASEQRAGDGKDPAHGAPRTMSRQETDEMAENEELKARIATLERREQERGEEMAAKVKELELRELTREAEAAVDGAIRRHKLTRAQRDWAVRYYSADKEGFATFLTAQPDVWTDAERGSGGAPKEPSTEEPTAIEREVARKMGRDPVKTREVVADTRSIIEKAREARQNRQLAGSAR